MKSETVNLLRFFQIPKKCIIPIYQRTYSWTEEECDLLWNDIIRIGSNEKISNHFVGSFVYVQDSQVQVASATPEYMVIDGQQRMTSISLLLLAIVNVLKKTNKEIQVSEDFKITANYIKNNYLLNSNEEGDRRYKLILTKSDKETYLSILDDLPLPADSSKRIVENYDFFQDKLSETDIESVFHGLQKLMIVEIALDRSSDNPQLIFESLNSTGLELSQADLIRNYVLMSLEPARQKRLYEEFWFPMERRFGHAEYSTYFDRFMRDYLTTRLGRIPNLNEVHKEFKFLSQTNQDESIEALVGDIAKFSEYFVNMSLGKESDPQLRKVFNNLNQLKVDVAYPFLLQIYEDFKKAIITKDEFIEVIEILESYVFRRAICEIPTASLNKTFANLYKEIDKANYLETFKASLLLKDSYRRFPSNEEFIRALEIKDVYNFRSKVYLLLKIENSKHEKESIEIGKLSIEHILPQNENLSSEWITDLGANWKEIQNKYLHTLGNLTLTGYNSELSDKPFLQKQAASGGFKDSPLFLNNSLKDLMKWDQDAILRRGTFLSELASKIWQIPNVDEEILKTRRDAKKVKKEVSEYSVNDYKHLQDEKIELFNSFSKAISEISPDVLQEIKKYYIAYKINDSNFACIVPQATRLRITLHLDFVDLIDPQEICIDVKGKGRWGGGSVQFGIYKESEIEYAIQLIKQSYDYVQTE